MIFTGLSTVAVGLLPTYSQVGILAPILLVSLRMIQGFAVAGEISGSSSLSLEHAPFGRRAFFTSVTTQGVQAGQILAAAVFLPLGPLCRRTHFRHGAGGHEYGWRNAPMLKSYCCRKPLKRVGGFALTAEGRTVYQAIQLLPGRSPSRY